MTKRRKPEPPTSPASPAVKPAPASYAPALNAGIQATTARVQEMHNAISGKTFDALLLLPGLSVPTRLVQGAHDAITTGVYAAVRHGTSALLALAGDADRRAAMGEAGRARAEARFSWAAITTAWLDLLSRIAKS